MISASLKIFKVKAKPGPKCNGTIGIFRSASLFPRRLNPFTVLQNDQIDAEIEGKILEITKRYLNDISSSKPHRLNPRATFSSLGLDSLDSIDLVIELEERLGIDVTDEDAEHKIKSIRDATLIFTEYSRKLPANNPSLGKTLAKASR